MSHQNRALAWLLLASRASQDPQLRSVLHRGFRYLASGVDNHVFLLQARREPLSRVVKVRRRGALHRKTEPVANAVQLARLLLEAGIRIPTQIRAGHHWHVEEFLDYEPFDESNANHIELLADALESLHQITATGVGRARYVNGAVTGTYSSYGASSLTLLQTVTGRASADVSRLRDVLVDELSDPYWWSQGDSRLLHGDLSRANIGVLDGRICFVDLGSLRTGDPIADFAGLSLNFPFESVAPLTPIFASHTMSDENLQRRLRFHRVRTSLAVLNSGLLPSSSEMIQRARSVAEET